MTVSSEAKRTLVKSPPELWSEVSDPESLARHLDGLQEIRITRAEPEAAVEWEADGASGSVQLQPSGFGTKVTLSLSRELPSAEPVAAEPEELAPEPGTAEPVAAEPEELAPEPVAAEPGPTVPDPALPEPEATEQEAVAVGTEPGPAVPEPEIETGIAVEAPRQGFFARLFKRRRKPPAPEPAASVEPEPEPGALAEPETVALAEPEPGPVEPEPLVLADPEPEPAAAVEPHAEPEHEAEAEQVEPPAATVTADLAALEAEMAQQDEAMLTAMLDRLGAAHHRPFSRG